jgi:CubicO group peptidase (beta-lactamase class C family)
VDVGRGAGPVRPLEAHPADLLDLRVPVAGTADASLHERLVQTATDAFIVLHEGGLVLEWYADPAAPDEPQALMSVTKSVVGCVAGILVETGALDPDALASTWVPELEGSGYAGVTVRDLLDMRTGGDHRERYDDEAGEVVQLGRVLAASAAGGGESSLDELVLHAARRALHAGPFAYRSLDTEVLGWVVERAAGAAMPALLEDLVLGPMGAERPGSMATDTRGRASHSGGLALSARDVARFGQLIADGGSVGGTQVVPTVWVKDTRVGAPDSAAAFRASLSGSPGGSPGESLAAGPGEDPGIPAAHYRNQFWVLHAGGRELLGLGIFGQYVHVDVEASTVVVKLSSWVSPQDPQAFSAGLACATTLAEHLGGHPSHGLNLHA